jgi:hypothetical protein
MPLTLRHHNAQAIHEGTTPQLWDEQLYYVFNDGRFIGQIRQHDWGPHTGWWSWCVLEGPRHYDEIDTSGFADDLEDCKMRFAACWESLQRRIAYSAKLR